MKGLISWFVRNPIAANLLMFSLIVAGLLGLIEVRKEEFPNIDVPAITVSVPYLGAAPSEVETGVCVRIEEAVQGVDGIDKVRAFAAEDRCALSPSSGGSLRGGSACASSASPTPTPTRTASRSPALPRACPSTSANVSLRRLAACAATAAIAEFLQKKEEAGHQRRRLRDALAAMAGNGTR